MRLWLLQPLLWLLVLGLVGPGQRAAAQPSPTSFARAFSSDLSGKLTKEVPLVAMEGARVVMANHERMEDLGLLKHLGIKRSERGQYNASYEGGLVKAFAFRPATQDEIARGAYTHTGIATYYQDLIGVNSGGVRGDGRAVLTGDVLVRDRRGRVTGIFDIQIKGIGTGLSPKTWGFDHTHGKEALRQALEDALYSDYLSRNGMRNRSNDWLAVIDTGQYINYPDGGKERAGLLVRGGNFLRMAHMQHLRHDTKALSELVDFANRQVSVEMGRRRKLSVTGLYKVLCQRKAHELADLYSLRSVHGSVTFDNIGLMENMDHGTASTVDRTHRDYTFFKCSQGYGREAAQVMAMYSSNLAGLLRQVASGKDAQALDRLNKGKMLDAMFQRRMARNFLLHSGFSEQDASRLLRRHRGETSAFERVVWKLANQTTSGQHVMKGPHDQVTVSNPARYDVFAALSKLSVLQVGVRDAERRARALAQVLRPEGQTVDDQTLGAARELLAAFDKVSSPVFSRLKSRSERFGLARAMRANATGRNRFADEMVRKSLRAYAGLIERDVVNARRPEEMDRVRAQINAFRRRNLVSGPGTAVHAAQSVLSGTAPRQGKRLVLSRHVENGVAIMEMSDGKRDFVQVKVGGNPLTLGDLKQYRMRLTTGAGKWQDVAPAKVTGNGTVVFDVEVTGKRPAEIQAAFFDQGNQGRWWNNASLNFGRDIRPVLGSANVDVALGVEARRRGQTRPGLRRQLQSYSEALFRQEQGRPVSKPRQVHQRKIGTPFDLRTVKLGESRGPKQPRVRSRKPTRTYGPAGATQRPAFWQQQRAARAAGRAWNARAAGRR